MVIIKKIYIEENWLHKKIRKILKKPRISAFVSVKPSCHLSLDIHCLYKQSAISAYGATNRICKWSQTVQVTPKYPKPFIHSQVNWILSCLLYPRSEDKRLNLPLCLFALVIVLFNEDIEHQGVFLYHVPCW